ncbi:M56 family metallopeptidase [Frigoriflavimonas asaccharolytica]|uniref:Beta-lactamase regulating signal transducer with metallopeptidase domain n=1 Tax=Frigoriflavimonas asaccharolytica TaxID=2735899 RepID=A0A8J8G902_9FLAO|nr:M56 family metallopeptidase [Frigoriflavimonas asaccharolytica]NRS92900.1 beta-lactamase regulating signal transducer with metallopeptidase domain [Frigoriflavimonas asaccharolytica]
METLIFYFGKVVLCSAVMFLYYSIFLKDKTFHHYNRFYLLGTLAISLVLPLLKVNYFTIKLNENFYQIVAFFQNNSPSNTTTNDISIFTIILGAVAVLSVFFIAKFSLALLKIHQLKREFPEENFEGISFFMTNLENAPFSFFKNLFWKDSILLQSDLGKQILKHEMVHIEQKHSIDKLCIEIITALFWFNPIFYLIKKEINLIHEYLADKKALKNSDTKAFAQMLLEAHFSGNVLPATSPFLNSNLKKRITMLKKSNTKFSYFRKVFALPLLFCLVFAYMVKAENREIRKDIISQENQISKIKNDTVNAETLYQEILVKLDPEQRKVMESLDPATLKNLKSVLKDVREKSIAGKKKGERYQVSTQLINTEDYLAKTNQLAVASEQNLAEYRHSKSNAVHAQLDSMIVQHNTKLENDKVYKANNEADITKLKLISDKIRIDNEAKLKNPKYYLDNIEISSAKFKNINPNDIKSVTVEKIDGNGKIYIESKSGNLDVEKQGLKNAPFKTIVSANSQQFLKNNDVIYSASSSYITDEDSTENETIVNDKNLKNADVYINGKLSDEKTAKALNPKKIKTVNIKRNKHNGEEKNEVRITTKR